MSGTVVVTGVAGFIGSRLAERLALLGYHVVGVDDLSTGSYERVEGLVEKGLVELHLIDLREGVDRLVGLARGSRILFHFAANPEVRHSTVEPLSHYHQNVTATVHVLEAARRAGVELVVFASSSTVYGDPLVVPTPEDHPLKPISVYGASKAAGEVFCETYARLYGFKCLILRYANIIGPGTRHGVVYDFIVKLLANPRRLVILGDGSQRKSYLYIDDAVEATLRAVEKALEGGRDSIVYNVGNTDYITVREIADIVVEEMGLEGVEYTYSPGTSDGRGWPGDVKVMLLDISRITGETGWRPRMGSREAVRLTAAKLVEELAHSKTSL